MGTHNHTLLVKPYLAVIFRIWNPFEHVQRALQEACDWDSFDAQFLEFGLPVEQLIQLKCCLWLQVTMVADITNGQRSTYSPSSSGWDTLHSSSQMVVLAQTRQTTSQLVGIVAMGLNENNTFN